MILRTLYITLLCVLSLSVFGQTQDNNLATNSSTDTTTSKNGFFHRFYRYFADANKEKEEKRFDFSVIGGPHFSSDTKLGLGLVASGLFRIDRNDKSISPSNISIYGDITTTGFYLLGIRGNVIFPQDRFRLNANMYFFSFPSEFWGIGYEAGHSDNSTEYKRLEQQVKFEFLWRLAPNLYVGPNLMFRNVVAKDFDDISYLNGAPKNVTTFGPGIIISYDSRDFIPNPARGIFVQLEQQFFPGFLGNDQDFKRTSFDFRYYRKAWKGAIVASQLQGIFNYGDTPWSMVALMGGSYSMRGYYEGRYRDNDLVQAQVELRQKIYNRHGITLWGGAGNVFPDMDGFKWDQTLPTYGIGYRWEFKNRINVRLDYGIGKGVKAFYFNINEAF
ncbi:MULTISPECIES: BamA/TamA family outer membrane protein [Butyricimonas]|uniref:BamA/TamA family outer membrane protein n=1 Tax=Butyricimonas TaxID=574697 RepID=UPI00035DC78D|nr:MULTISPECIES: BamA/TamA family outer membrane protein [Butyricimonas]